MAALKPYKTCRACGESKPRSDYEPHSARRCAKCATPTPCTVCGTPCDPTHATCRTEDCIRIAQERAGRKGAAAIRRKWKRALRRRTHKCCPGCDRWKPYTTEFFYTVKRDPETGEIARLSAYCKPCERANQRALYAISEDRRRKVGEAAKRQRQQIKERRAADPEFDAQHRALIAEYSSGARRRVLTDTGPTVDRSPYLDPKPFLAWVDRTWPKYGTMDFFCEVAGLSHKNITRLRRGVQQHVQLDTVDHAIIREGSTTLDMVYGPDAELVIA